MNVGADLKVLHDPFALILMSAAGEHIFLGKAGAQ
jgi:hypothetical protein